MSINAEFEASSCIKRGAKPILPAKRIPFVFVPRKEKNTT